MCRNIKPLFNYDPPVTDGEIFASSLQYVRKVSGFTKSSQMNKEAFESAVVGIASVTKELLRALQTRTSPRNREAEIAKARERTRKVRSENPPFRGAS